MVRWSVAALAILLTAGCLGAGPPPGETPAPAPTPGVAAQWLATPFTGTETKVAVAPTGTLFYAGARADPNAPVDGMVSTVHRSRDGGTTWQDVTPRLPTGQPAPPDSVDPILAVDPDTGRLFFASMFPRDVCGFVSWSDDEGDTWASSPLLCGTHPPFDHPFIVAARPRLLHPVGYPNVVHVCVNQVGDTQCLRSLDGGRTWLVGAAPFLGLDPGSEAGIGDGFVRGFCGGLSGEVQAAPDGTLYLPREYCQRPYVAVSRDDGTTWSAVRVSPKSASNGHDPDVAVDADGNAYYTWTDTGGIVWLTTSRDGGATWSDALRVTPEGVTGTMPVVAVGAPGRVAVGFVGTADLPRGYLEPDLHVDASERDPNGTVMRAAWSAWAATSADALSPNGTFLAAAVSPEPLLRGLCDPRYCPGPYSDYDGAAVGADGRAYLSFVDWCPGPCATPGDVHNEAPGAASLAVLEPWGPRLTAPF